MNTNFLIILQIFAILLILIPLNGLIIRSFSIIAQKAKLSRTFIILFIVGFASAIPEIFIGINSAILNQPEIGIGNAIGTGIVLVSFVAGIVALYNKGFKTNKVFTKGNLIFISLTTLAFIVLGMDGFYSRLDGVILILTYVVYLILLSYYKNQFEVKSFSKIKTKQLLLNVLIAVVGLVITFLASYLLNLKAGELAKISFMPEFFIGLMLLAPLSGIPELIYEFQLHKRSLTELSLGEIFTSLVTNTTLTIGIIILISPLTISNPTFFYFTGLYMCILLVMFNIYIRTKNELSWKEGMILIFSYIIFMLSSISLLF
jgi:cation:H+ antiporter